MQVSFVNSICTVKGGTHVDYIVNQITKCAQAKQQHQSKNLTTRAYDNMKATHKRCIVFIPPAISNMLP